jgi:hypothetical protein
VVFLFFVLWLVDLFPLSISHAVQHELHKDGGKISSMLKRFRTGTNDNKVFISFLAFKRLTEHCEVQQERIK